MITFIDKETDNGHGVDWITIESMHSDACVILVGETSAAPDFPEISSTEYTGYCCLQEDVAKISEFVNKAKPGDTYSSEYLNTITRHTLSLKAVEDAFIVTVEEKVETEGQNLVNSFSYKVPKEEFLRIVAEMLSLQEEE